MRAQRRHDLNRLLDEPGPGALIFAVVQICLLEIVRRDMLPMERLSMSPFETANAAVDARLTRWCAQSGGIQNKPTPQLAGAAFPTLTAGLA